MDNQTAAAPAKKIKKKGPIRFEAVVPIAIIVATIAVYFTLFFDGHLRRGLEWVGTQANGAEVNIGSLKTRFTRAEVIIQQVEATDPQQPSQNRLGIGRIEFRMLWDALLRGKVVVEVASVNGIEVASPRKKPGYVLPPPAERSGPSFFDEAKEKIMAQVKEQFQSTGLSSISGVLKGFDPTEGLKDLGELKSAARIQSLNDELPKKEKLWRETVQGLGDSKQVQALAQKVGQIQVGGDPAAVPGKIAELSQVIQQSQQLIAQTQAKAEVLTRDVSEFSKSLTEIDSLIEKDRREIESRLKFPRLDSKGLSEALFGDLVLSRVAGAQRYIDMGRKYMPPKKSERESERAAQGEIQVQPHPRAQGVSYEFGRPKGYPLFWLKKAEISSTGEYSAVGGDVKGVIQDVTSHPSLLGRPMIAKVEGDFPKKDVRNVLLQASLDHTKSVARDSLILSVGAYPLKDLWLNQEPDTELGITQAVGQSSIRGVLEGDQIELSVNQQIHQPSYHLKVGNDLLNSILQNVTHELKMIQLAAKVSGSWSALKLSLESNFGSALERGLQKQLQGKIQEARKKIDDLIEEKIGKPKRDLMSKFTSTQSQVQSQIDQKKKEAEGVIQQAQAKSDQVKNQADQMKNRAIEELKKKLPF